MISDGDIFHTNSLEILDGRLAEAIPAFKKGNVLISILMLSVVAVIDLEQRKAVWAMKGEFQYQHHPTLLDNGNMLLFDNAGRGSKSTICEIEPLSQKTVWTYQGNPAHPFYSRSCGACYRLPNGNTLITESDGGRAFEVTDKGTIVWEYFNPNRTGSENEYIATLFDLQRIPTDFVSSWLD
jgi:hypothetical protein